MKDNDIHNLIDRLQGFDGDELRREMTDGLDEWCRQRRQRDRMVKRTLLLALLLLTTTAIAMTALPMLRPAKSAATEAAATPEAPVPPSGPASAAEPADSVVVGRRVSEPAVDYYYTGLAEDGYSVAYGHDTRTLTYTRYSGSHLIHSVIHDSPDIFSTDTAEADTATLTPQDDLPLAAPRSQVPCDFQTVSPQGDALYYVVVDSLNRHVSVRGDVARWMGQSIRYNTVLLLPDTVEHEGLRYAVTALADSAFMGHDEIEKVYIPATVTHIGDNAFAGCLALQSLTVLTAVPPEAFPASFDRVDARLRLTVPCGSGNAYANDAEWLYFRNIIENCPHATPIIRVIRKQ
ncbi:MAG: leucine-rich repeat protein [Bacteroidales bacterium]|nr:leucine-rich repeat protein [Bacteroidales bacterium]